MKTSDSIALSYSTIKSNLLRTTITVIIIALGIMALIAIITAVEAVSKLTPEILTEIDKIMGSKPNLPEY